MTGSPVRRPLAAVALLLVLAGCSATNPIQTDHPYPPADGVLVQVGDVRAENLLVVSTAAGAPGALSGALVNDGGVATDVTISVGSWSTKIAVPAESSVLIGTGSSIGERVPVPTVTAPPGALLDPLLSTPAAGTVHVQVPVLNGANPQYTAVLGG